MVRKLRDDQIQIVCEFPHIDIVSDTKPVDQDQDQTKPTVYLAGPHGIFGLGAKRLMGTALVSPGSVAMFDSTIYHTCPGATWSARVLGHPCAPLTHKSVSRLMGMGKNLMLLPGGFVETVGATGVVECIYIDKIPYYQKMCKRYGYRLQYLMMYGGSNFYRHHAICRDKRLDFARMNIPAAIVTPKNVCGTDKIAVRPFNIDLEASLARIIEKIETVYTLDLAILEHEGAIKMKPLEVIK
jgi:hypothetical protein